MHDSRAKSVATQIGMLGMLLIVVTVLTLSFNVCGALFVAVIAGMMAGASRRWKWQMILVSLVSPFVVLAFGNITKVDLDARQSISLAAVCLGAFWMTYLVTFLLMCMEKQSGSSPGQSAARPASGVLQPQGDVTAESLIPGVAMATSETKHQLGLHHLQGTWHSEVSHPDEPPHKKVFAIKKNKFSLSIVNGSGRAQLVAQGNVLVRGASSTRSLIISGTSGEEPISLS